jgi:hypothetical protein
MKIVRRTFAFTVIVCLLYGLGFLTVQLFPGLVSLAGDRFRPAANGLIHVTSPTVYTRQRLVNDRLAQTSWLQDQLRVTNVEEKEFRPLDRLANVTALSFSQAGANIQANLASGSKPRTQTADSDKNKNPDATKQASEDPKKEDTTRPPGELAFLPTSSTMFRAKNSYRDEVRAEMMEAQLDDRHDIRGNTAYRLAFNISVLPTSDNNGLALTFIKLRQSPAGKELPRGPEEVNVAQLQAARSAYPGSSKLSEHSVTENDLLYADWLRYVQRVVDESLNGIVTVIKYRKFSKEQRIASSVPILVKTSLCGAFSSHPGQDCNPASTSEPMRAARKAMEEYSAAYLARRTILQKDRFKDAIKAAVNRRPPGKSADANEYLYAAEIAYAGDIPPRRSLLECKVLPDKSSPQVEIPAKSNKDNLAVPCPIVDDPSEGMVAAILLYSKLKSTQRLHGPIDNNFVSNAIAQLQTRCREDDYNGCELADSQLKCVAADILKAQLYNEPEMRPSPTGWRMKQFLELQVIGEEVANCSIGVQSIADGAWNLAKALDDGVEVFTYSVNPRNLAQRVSLSAKNSESTQASLSADVGTPTQKLGSWARRWADRISNSQAVDETPIVVGFSRPVEPNSADSKRANDYSRETAFGWAIAPQTLGTGNVQQIDNQYPVSAVVSLPAWWRSIELEVSACWARRADLAKAADLLDSCGAFARPSPSSRSAEPHREQVSVDSKSEASGESAIHSLGTYRNTVRLPGAISELSSKLGFEIVQEPHLKVPLDQAPPLIVAEVGRSLDILLTGFRIWRSTEVTLGAQKSNRIVVLPNMEGIIASFDCVEPQTAVWAESSSTEPVRQHVDVKVWTSEGVTEPLDATLVIPPSVRAVYAKNSDSLRSLCPSQNAASNTQAANR